MFHPLIDRASLSAALAAALVLLAAPDAVRAQELNVANQFFKEGDLRKAERYYRQALRTLPAAQQAARERCHDQLLVIYPRLGRCDRAIEIGEPYAARLAKAGKEPHRRTVLKQLGVCYFVLGHYGEARKRFEEVVRDEPADIDPLVVAEAHAYLARLQRPEDADEHWEKVRTKARTALIKAAESLTAAERAVCVRLLADSQRLAGQSRGSDYTPGEAGGGPGPGQALRRAMRDAAAARGASGGAGGQIRERRWRMACRRARPAPGDCGLRKGRRVRPRAPGRSALRIGWVPAQRGQQRDGAEMREKAATLYAKALAEVDPQQPERASPAAAFWKLHQLYQHVEPYQRALLLVDGALRGKPGRKTPLEQCRLRAEQAIIRIYRDGVDRGRKSLESAADELKQQQPVNLVDLPRVLTSLAVVELHSADVRVADDNHVAKAAELAHQVRKLYVANALPADAVLAETSNILGLCDAWRGDDRKAVAHFRAAAELCKKLIMPERGACNLLLSIAILHRSREELAEACTACREALDAYRGIAGKAAEEQLGDACLRCAAGGHGCGSVRCIGRGAARFDALGQQGKRLDRLCDEHRIKEGPLLCAALHCQALARLAHKDFAAARPLWRRLADVQDQAIVALPDDPRHDPLLAETLNWLALTAALDGQAAVAEKLYAEALQRGGRASSATRYTTLWRLALLLDRRGEHKQSRKMLEQAPAIASERGIAADVNATCERLVEQCVRDGKSADALVFSARGRSRRLLDQLQRAGVDYAVGLGEDGKHLCARAESLRRASAVSAHLLRCSWPTRTARRSILR